MESASTTQRRNRSATGRESATEDVREAIDAASERVRAAAHDATDRAQGEARDWLRALEQAGDDLRQLGVLAIRAENSPEALSAMSAEIRKRRAQLGGTVR